MTVLPIREGFGGQWTGFVLVIVPITGLAVDADELFREVQEQVESDVVLQDTVRVGISADAADGQGAASVVDALARTAMSRNGMFAPRAMFGCVVVGNDAAETERVAKALMQSPILKRLYVHFYGVVARPSSAALALAEEFPADVVVHPADGEAATDNSGASGRSRARPDLTTIAEVVEKAIALMNSFEATSSRAISSHKFTAMMSRPSAPTVPRRAIDANTHEGPAHPTGHRGVQQGQATIKRVGGLARYLPAAKPAKPTQAETLDRLAGATEAAALVYLVLVPDRARAGRNVHRRRSEVVVELDRALADARLQHGPGGGPILVEVALLIAGRRLTRHGPLGTAGEFGLDQVPKMAAGHFDLVRCIDDLIEIYEWDSASLERRGVETTGAHVIFVSTDAPLADSVSIDRFEHLSSILKVQWILFGNAWDLMSSDFAAAGVQSFQEHPDVASELVTSTFTETSETEIWTRGRAQD